MVRITFEKRSSSSEEQLSDVAIGLSYVQESQLIDTECCELELAIFDMHTNPPLVQGRIRPVYPRFDVAAAAIKCSVGDNFVKLYCDLGLWSNTRFLGNTNHFGHFISWRDCTSGQKQEDEPSLTPSEVIARLQVAKQSWDIEIEIQKRETDFIVESAMVFLDSSLELPTQPEELCYSFLDVFQNLSKYSHFLDCRAERAQALIDAIQTLLDNGVMEQKFRSIFVTALVALAMRSQQYPRRLMLQDVTYQLEELNNSSDIDGFLNEKEVKIMFDEMDSEKKYWIKKVILAAQVPAHENVLQFLGLVSSPDPIKYFPGIASQGRPDKGLERLDIFLNSEQAANTHTRRSLIMDIAAGISHICKNGMGVDWRVWSAVAHSFCPIFIASTTTPHALLGCWAESLQIAEPMSSGFWLNLHDMDKFIEINSEIGLWDFTQSETQDREKDSVEMFCKHLCTESLMHTQILEYNRPSMKWLSKTLSEGKAMPPGFLQDGIDVYLWQLLLDCRSENHNAIPSTSVLILPFKLLDIIYFPELNRSQVIAALQRFSKRRNMYPTHFFLDPSSDAQDLPLAATGGFADIYKVTSHQVETCFKVIRVYEQTSVEHLKKVYAKEAIVWAQLSHPNILPFFGISKYQSRLAFVTAWATNGHVNGYLTRNPDADRVLLVLVDGSGRAAIADFGLANVTDPYILKWTSQSTVASKGGTTRWLSPEILAVELSEDMADESASVHNTKASDVFAWSSIFTGQLPFFETLQPVSVMHLIMQGETPTRPQDDSPAWRRYGLNHRIWNLMKDCWSFDPSQRPDMTAVILRLDAEERTDTRPPGEWNENSSVRFRNAEKVREVQDSPEFWDGVKSLLLEVVPDLESKEVEEDI
ncbi:hypothetical protein H0H92_002787 [Tricholoma furcatifolium]|nr:hypothetical protein H0H92_002787 [Tricholoma furcatifolium]